MRITPLDIRNHGFPRRISGYDRDEVDAFLRMVAEDYEVALRGVEAARTKIRNLEARVAELSSSEQLLKETLTTAQQLADDLKQTAMKEAEVLVGQAEIKGEKVLEAAHKRAARLAEDIREMKRLRTRLAGALRGTIERHLEMVDHLSEDPPAEHETAIEQRVDVLASGSRPAESQSPRPAASAPEPRAQRAEVARNPNQSGADIRARADAERGRPPGNPVRRAEGPAATPARPQAQRPRAPEAPAQGQRSRKGSAGDPSGQ